jgi:membrane peptidoglycan carboxypeptidase
VPQYLQDALIATEDRRFYKHHGVDLRGLIRSAINTSNGDTQGGSTLTMQYVKQLRYYQAGDDVKKQQQAVAQTLDRKIEDAKCAISFERIMSKQQILANYLNIAFFGENSYGIETAAETYFDKHSAQLTLPESAMLVGLLRAPTAYDPFLHPEAAKQRRNQVLDNLVAVHKLSAAEADRLKQTPIALATSSPPQVRQGCANSVSTVKNGAFFCEYVLDWLEKVEGIPLTTLQTGGLKVTTTLSPRVQNLTQAAVARRIPAASPMTAIMPVVDPRTGDVLAMAASKTFGTKKGQTEQPLFTEYSAPGASTYKLFPMLAALSTGFPSSWKMETAANTGNYLTKNCYTPSSTHNGDSGETYSRNESLKSAIAKSSNTFFVGLIDVGMNCTLAPSINLAVQLGMNGLNQPSDNAKLTWVKQLENLQRAQQFALGDIPTSPLELAGAYAAVANNGVFNAPAPVLTITDSTGQNQIAVKRSPGVPVIAPQVAQEAAQLLEGDTHFPGTSASEFSSAWYGDGLGDVAGKTGTAVAVDPRTGKETNRNAAIWFVGMTPTLTATTAIVNLDHPNWASRGLPGAGTGTAYGGYAASVWISALKPYLAHQSWSWPTTASGSEVPDIAGLELAAAKARLSAAGFKMQQLAGGASCASSRLPGTVAYFGPSLAPRGATITVCPSSGAEVPVYTPPPPPRPSHTPAPSPSGSTTTGPGGGRTTTVTITVPPPGGPTRRHGH